MAAAELRNVELSNQQIEFATRQLAVISAQIDASFHRADSGKGFWIIADLTLRNSGTREARLLWQGERPAFSVHEVAFDANGAPQFRRPLYVRVRRTSDPNQEATSLVIRAGATDHLTFAVNVQEAGLYFLSFRAALDPDEGRISRAVGATGKPAWTASRFLPVGRINDAN
jgi:hypothetical protein